MRVLLGNSESGFRGGEHQTLALARGLAARGCDVAIAARAGSALASRAQEERILCRPLAYEKMPLVTPVFLVRFIEAWRPDVCHAQTADAHTHFWIARALSPQRPPLVVSRRVAFEIRRTPLSLLKYRTGVSRFIPISRAAALSLFRVGVHEEEMTIVPSGIETARFKGGRKTVVRSRWGIGADEIIVGTVAALEEEKGLPTLIDAAASIAASGRGARFVIVGEGRLERRLTAQVGALGLGSSVLLARQEEPLEETLGAFDIFVLPSLAEGLSTALLAAMASGLAVVASDTGGIPDAVSSDCGILVPPGNAEVLAGALTRLMDDESLRVRMGEAGRGRAANFDISMTIEKTLGIYESIARGPQGPKKG